jgi:hypothetical protein
VVRGLEVFGKHFRKYSDSYVLIGGTACDLAMRAAGLDFRATKDLDIVLLVESLNDEFVKTFWSFVRAGGYERREKQDGSRCYYRFTGPSSGTHPSMLELFSRAPDALTPVEGSFLTPVPTEGEVSSLSAILLDEEYYRFLCAGKREEDGLSYVGAERLIPLKARAWLDLTARKKAGGQVDGRDIRKHRNDVFRLYRVLEPGSPQEVPLAVRQDLRDFASAMAGENIGLEQLGLQGTTVASVLDELGRVYALE